LIEQQGVSQLEIKKEAEHVKIKLADPNAATSEQLSD